MKKVIILSPAHPLRGGIASSSERLCEELQASGIEASIYSFSLQYPRFLFPGKTQYTDDPPPANVAIQSVINSINPFNWWKVGRQIRREKPDVLLIRYWLPFMAPCLGTIAYFSGVPAIALVDNIIPHEKRPGDRWFTLYFIRQVKAFIVMSKSVGDQIRLFNRSKPVVHIPHPIYDNYGELASQEESLSFFGLPQGPLYLLFFGFVRPYKGLDLLLNALLDERLQECHLHLLVAGEFYSREAETRAFISENNLEEKVTIHSDYIPNEKVRYYFGLADLVVQPYRSATQSGISQLAYHFEKPMVVTNVGGLPDIVENGQTGYVVPVNAEAISQAIRTFAKEADKEQLSIAVRERKKDFSWQNMVAGIRQLYNQVKI